jgi:membrane-bound serine protease (ClpP class)
LKRTYFALSFLVLSFVLQIVSLFLQERSFAETQTQSVCTTQIHVEGIIGPATVDYLKRAEERTHELGCQSILMLINTPGGNLQSTRAIVERILNSDVPYLCLVSPAGAHAGSAGAIILLACHVAGALEATNIGAATPISGDGQDIPSDLRKKILNDTLSWVDGLMKLRERNLKFGKEIITDAKALSANEAEKIGAIDFVGKNVLDFLNFSRGRTVKMSDAKTLKVAVGEIKQILPDLRFRILDLLADPQLAYLLFMGSLALLYFEITHPGVVAPGVLGAIGLVLSLITLEKLDVQWGGLALLGMGLIFLIAEAFVPSFGALGIGGIVAFVVGSIFLFDPSSGYTIPLQMILATASLFGGIMMFIAYMAFQTFKLKRHRGMDSFIGQTGEVTQVNTDNSTLGWIEIQGENWKVEADTEIKKGDLVQILKTQGLTLKVKKKEQV